MFRACAVIEPLERRQLLTVGSGFVEAVVGQGLRMPTAMVVSPAIDNPPILIAEKAGQVRRFQSGVLEREPLVYIEDVVATGDLGLVGIAVDRNFQRNRNVYVNYTIQKPTDPAPHQRISRFFLAGDELIAETVLLELPSWEDKTVNVGGGLEFAFDGTLLIGVGDGGEKEQAGDLGSPFGKILRIRPDGTIPSNNPYADGEGWQKYVWAHGLRDPAKFAVNVQNGTVYINDPGEEKFEEINIGQPGGDYGWPTTEGGASPLETPSQPPSGPIGPVFAFPHQPREGAPLPAGTVVGGHVAGGTFFIPGTLTFPVPYAGDYFFADKDQNVIRVLGIDKLTPNGDVLPFATDITAPVDLGYTARGDMFVIAQGVGDAGGQLIRYHPTGAPAIVRQPDDVTVVAGQQAKLTVSAGGLEPLSYQWQVNGQDIPGATTSSLAVGPFGPADTGISYTVRIRNDQGEVVSAPATITVTAAGTGNGPDPGGGTGGDGGSGGGNPGGGSGGGTGAPNPFKPPKEPKPMGPIDLLPVIGPSPFAAVGASRSAVAVKVLNVGLDTARGALNVRLYLSSQATPAVGADDVMVAETTRLIRIVPGRAKNFRFKVTWPTGIDGSYHLLAVADPANLLPETNEGNNVAVSATPTQVSPAFIDVRTQVGAAPASASTGQQVSLPVSVFNDGNTKALSDLTLLVYAVPQVQIAEGATASEAAAFGQTVVQQPVRVTLAAGRGKMVKLKFAIPDSLPAGPYVLVATADGASGEADATNNASVGIGIVEVL